MTPYRKDAIVILDPNLKDKPLMFGEVPERLFKPEVTGLIVDTKYMGVKKTMVYQVKFDNKNIHWFKETELVLVMS